VWVSTAVAAWRAAGEVWNAVSSRLIKARLKWVGQMATK